MKEEEEKRRREGVGDKRREGGREGWGRRGKDRLGKGREEEEGR